jgi:Pentapeptide repeats (8 copies)
VIGTTKDVALILNTSSSPLPIINAPIRITGFYVVGATLLAAIYCYFHFYLQPLWRALASLPAVFRDGVAQDDKTDPWQLTNLVRTEFPQLRATAPPLARLENRLSIVLAWWLVPVTLFALWARYLPAHDISGLTWLAFLIGTTTFFGHHTFRLARATLRGEMPLAGTTTPGGRSPTVLRRILRELPRLRGGQITIWFLLPFLIMVGLSISASTQSPRAADGRVGVFSLGAPAQVLRTIGPTSAQLLNFAWIRTYADLREVEVAEMPPDWDGKNWGEIRRVELRGRNLAFADATSAFLANADLRGATLTGAQLGFAQLQGADLKGPSWRARSYGRPRCRAPCSPRPDSSAPTSPAPISTAPTSARPNSGAPPLAGPISRMPISRGRSSRALTCATRSCRAQTWIRRSCKVPCSAAPTSRALPCGRPASGRRPRWRSTPGGEPESGPHPGRRAEASPPRGRRS